MTEEKAEPTVAKPWAPKSTKIKVVALKEGVFKRSSKNPGDKFEVDSFNELGSWMLCLDPETEKKHLEFLRGKMGDEGIIARRK